MDESFQTVVNALGMGLDCVVKHCMINVDGRESYEHVRIEGKPIFNQGKLNFILLVNEATSEKMLDSKLVIRPSVLV